jgi:hypothetical protein
MPAHPHQHDPGTGTNARGDQRAADRARTSRGDAAATMARVSVCVLVMAAGLAGCSKPLLSPRESRTQYDNYLRSRNEYAPQFLTDEYGVRQPNLRGRLVLD